MCSVLPSHADGRSALRPGPGTTVYAFLSAESLVSRSVPNHALSQAVCAIRAHNVFLRINFGVKQSNQVRTWKSGTGPSLYSSSLSQCPPMPQRYLFHGLPSLIPPYFRIRICTDMNMRIGTQLIDMADLAFRCLFYMKSCPAVLACTQLSATAGHPYRAADDHDDDNDEQDDDHGEEHNGSDDEHNANTDNYTTISCNCRHTSVQNGTCVLTRSLPTRPPPSQAWGVMRSAAPAFPLGASQRHSTALVPENYRDTRTGTRVIPGRELTLSGETGSDFAIGAGSMTHLVSTGDGTCTGTTRSEVGSSSGYFGAVAPGNGNQYLDIEACRPSSHLHPVPFPGRT
eukprot:2037554-Rhodomonas_salina.2